MSSNDYTQVPTCAAFDPQGNQRCELPRGHAGDHETLYCYSRTWDKDGWTDE